MKILKQKISKYLLWKKHSKSNKIALSADIHKNTEIAGSCVIGEDVVLGEDVKLSKGVRVGRGSSLSRITVGENSFIDSRIVCTGHGNGKINIGKECYVGLMNVLDWSDDITISDADLPYPSGWINWQTYSDPKIEVIEGATYWLVISGVSSSPWI